MNFTSGSSANVSNIELQFHGGCSFIGNLIKGKIEGALRKAISESLGPKLPTLLNKILTGMHTPSTINIIPGLISLDVKSSSLPKGLSDSISFVLDGEFLFRGQSTPVNCAVTQPPSFPSGFALQVSANECFFNSLGSVLHSVGFFNGQFEYNLLGASVSVNIFATAAPLTNLEAGIVLESLSLGLNVRAVPTTTDSALQLTLLCL